MYLCTYTFIIIFGYHKLIIILILISSSTLNVINFAQFHNAFSITQTADNVLLNNFDKSQVISQCMSPRGGR